MNFSNFITALFFFPLRNNSITGVSKLAIQGMGQILPLMLYIRVSNETWLLKVHGVVLHFWPLRIWALYTTKHCIINYLSRDSWQSGECFDDPNLAWQAWKSGFNVILDHHAPIRHMRVRQSSVPWLTFDIKKMMKGRDYHKNMLLNTARTTTGYFINLPEII